MRRRNGFSLIETLVAVILASISALALLQVVSTSSRTSFELISRFDESLVMGLTAGMIDEGFDADTVHTGEMLQSRYAIDHPDIVRSLEPFSYTVEPMAEESIDPLMTMTPSGIPGSSANLLLRKIVLRGPKDEKTFFRMTAGPQ